MAESLAHYPSSGAPETRRAREETTGATMQNHNEHFSPLAQGGGEAEHFFSRWKDPWPARVGSKQHYGEQQLGPQRTSPCQRGTPCIPMYNIQTRISNAVSSRTHAAQHGCPRAGHWPTSMRGEWGHSDHQLYTYLQWRCQSCALLASGASRGALTVSDQRRPSAVGSSEAARLAESRLWLKQSAAASGLATAAC